MGHGTGGVLSIHEDYFLLTGGIERWLYRVARKHAGNQEWAGPFTMRQLYEKSGSAARLSDFALDVRKIVAADALPEYALTMSIDERGGESVSMVRRCLLEFDDPRFQPSTRRNGRQRFSRFCRVRHGLLGVNPRRTGASTAFRMLLPDC